MNAFELARRKLELTQIKLARKCGVSASTVSLWESGLKRPDDEQITRIAKALEITEAEAIDLLPAQSVDA